MGTREMRKKVKKYIDEADDHVVRLVYSMLEADRKDDLPKDIQNSVLRAEKELKEGKGIPHDVVMKKYSKWLTK